jgi:hypothetical protein
MITNDQVRAIYQLYPQVTKIVGDTAYDVDGNEVPYDLQTVTTQAQKNVCKQKARELLYATDWTTIPDVASSLNSPYLTNQAEFITWRSQIRQLAVNPVADPTWPTEPTPVWG